MADSEEGIKQLGQRVAGNSRTAVSHRYSGKVCFPSNCDNDRPSFRSVLDRIIHKICENLADTVGIRQDSQWRSLAVKLQLLMFGYSDRLNLLDNIRHNRRQYDLL